jgi:hypothetical protein
LLVSGEMAACVTPNEVPSKLTGTVNMCVIFAPILFLDRLTGVDITISTVTAHCTQLFSVTSSFPQMYTMGFKM